MKQSTKYIFVMAAWAAVGLFELFLIFGAYSSLNQYPMVPVFFLGVNSGLWPFNIMFYRQQKMLESIEKINAINTKSNILFKSIRDNTNTLLH